MSQKACNRRMFRPVRVDWMHWSHACMNAPHHVGSPAGPNCRECHKRYRTRPPVGRAISRRTRTRPLRQVR